MKLIPDKGQSITILIKMIIAIKQKAYSVKQHNPKTI